MSLKRIHLELARTPDFPNGSSAHGFEFIAPLDAKGHLNSAALAPGQGGVHRPALLGRHARRARHPHPAPKRQLGVLLRARR